MESLSGQNFAAFDIHEQGECINGLNAAETTQLLKLFRQQSEFRDVRDTQAFPYYLMNYEKLLKHAQSQGIDVTQMGVNFDHLGQNIMYFTHDQNSLNDIKTMSAAEALGVLEQVKIMLATHMSERVAKHSSIILQTYGALITQLQSMKISVD